MAKRKIVYRYKKAKKAFRRSRGFGKGGKWGFLGTILDGAIVGGIQGMIPDDALWGYGDALVPIGVGWFRKNDTLKTIGGYQLGLKIAESLAKQGATPGFKGQA